jgi:hypothetical protein
MTAQVMQTIRLRKHIFKGCSRCSGDLRLERDADSLMGRNPYSYVCLQCGRNATLRAVLGRPRETEAVAAA